MSLNNIEIHPHMLAGMYAEVLLENKISDSTIQIPSTPFRYLGTNQKKITVIVNHLHVPFLPDDELNFLTSILNACKLSLADIAIVNYQHAGEAGMEAYLEHLSPGRILLFALEPSALNLPIHFPQYQLQQFNNRTYLHAPSLSEIEKDKALKQRLWLSLKTMFGL